MLKNKIIKFNSKIIFFLLIVLCCLFSMYRGKREIQEITEDRIVKAEKNYKNIENKLNILNLEIFNLKTTDVFRSYFFEKTSESEKRYLKIKLYDQLKKLNTIYGNIGFSISLGSANEKTILATEGTVDRTTYFKEQGFPDNLENLKKYILIKDDKIVLYLKTEEEKGVAPVYWIIFLTKESFFSEIKFELDEWFIENGSTYVNLESDKIHYPDRAKFKRKILNFSIPYFNTGLSYVEPPIDSLFVYFMEFTKMMAVFAVVSLLFFLVKYFIVAPIKSLSEKFGYSGKNIKKEVEYIEQKIEEISFTNKNLQYTISDMKAYQKEKKIKDYLLGIIEKENLDQIKSESPIFDLDKYRVIILEVFDADLTENIYEKFRITKDFFVKYFSREIMCEIIDIDYKSIAIILEDKLTEEELEEVMICLEKHCENNFDLIFTIAITDLYSDMKKLSRAYREAKKVLDYKFVFKEKRVIFQNSIQDSNFKTYYYPVELEGKLINKTLNSSETSIRRVLSEIFDENNRKEIDKNELKEFAGLLYNTLNRMLIQLKELNSDIELKEFNIEEILTVDYFNQLKKLFENKIFEIYKAVKFKSTTENIDTREKIEKYLEDNYMIDISLDDLADFLGHSFKYTSVLFKKVMGDNFKPYLNMYRIDKAKKIMEENPDVKIKELAEMVGYNSSNTFIRIFKKYEGVSPGKINLKK